MSDSDIYEDKMAPKAESIKAGLDTDSNPAEGEVENPNGLQRRLENRQIQLIAIGGSIGTALFVTIGNGLAAGGPASLFLAYTFYCVVLACVNNCIAEMTTLHPVPGGFIRLAGKWVDDALGFMVGWNFFIYEALMIPFEITAINLILSYWRDDIPVAAVCAACIVLYGLINALAVSAFGEAEFWLSSGKVILIFILFFFTFITMVGGNPQHDAYGFRYWNNPSAFAPYRAAGNLGRFEGLLSALWSAAFCIVGPEYISMTSAEAKRPRVYIKSAFKTIYWRFILFFVLSSICVGIVVPWNDPTIQAILNGNSNTKGAGASPYIIAMTNLKITILPHIVNALLVTSVFSAGNTLTYCASRSLYGLALEGRAPKVLTKTMRGIPVYCLAVVMCFPFLSFLQMSSSTSQVITWLVDLVTAGALIDFLVICITYLRFHAACKRQNFDRSNFPYVGYFQPYCAWVGIVVMTIVLFSYGYSAFDPWSVQGFFQNYTMQLVAPILYFGWKLAHRTKIVKLEDLDLIWDRPLIDAYEASLTDEPTTFWGEVLHMFRFKVKQSSNSTEADESQGVVEK
ncbi:amino acid permease/ SLC12A domain-containing protein [Penicillium angulare]|uniref:amino acid permease/ SLC12A domain-containing protein n=1 Tax=Penicillium angulare TaxID=116970 RepID=UPI00253FC3D3|nr:amino acid permease/ SLC12A domain-containing protein [Penicillium angulare]KAJ5286749.1 amino acid permease/ SLC12A domain-containing protein [Penicillium angulare]